MTIWFILAGYYKLDGQFYLIFFIVLQDDHINRDVISWLTTFNKIN